ncbi:MAG TPA: pyruvate kinase [Allosphingosinicella sp.]|jgi:pyruvate kinase|uniref:pyruvate kinase n=1 Tax=Allosphingosinicella sp. TaxID=2823234 RepID=UPI002F26F035
MSKSPSQFTPRSRKVRILATLGPASATPEMIRQLLKSGADAFRLNMSHGSHADHLARIEIIRSMEKELERPTTILADLQGPKLRVGRFEGDKQMLENGQTFVFDRDETPGTTKRVNLPHREIFEAVAAGTRLLIDDGKLVLRVTNVSPDRLETMVEVGGAISNNKGLNVPDAVLPMAALTDKDRTDLHFALDHHVDWIALSFVQRPEDVAEARRLIAGRAALLAKIEKPAALDRLDGILELSDAVMVARGDLGVELPPEEVPPMQKRIVESARRLGRPVVVATQMLESMITSPSPTRAEVSDVATAVYDGADAIMLSAESASGQFPLEAVSMMNRIATSVERDPGYSARVHFTETPADPTTNDAIAEAAANIVGTVSAAAIVCFTLSGSTARRVARERPSVPLLVLTPSARTARRMGLLWGAHAVRTRDVASFEEMVGKAKRMALRHGLGKAGDRIVVIAGVPFGTPGSTNVVHVVRLAGDELERHKPA